MIVAPSLLAADFDPAAAVVVDDVRTGCTSTSWTTVFVPNQTIGLDEVRRLRRGHAYPVRYATS